MNRPFLMLSYLLLLSAILAVFGVHGIDQSPCSLPAESGPCRAYVPSYYYDTGVDQCKSFIYGGCRGNANRFGTVEDCQNFRQRCLRERGRG